MTTAKPKPASRTVPAAKASFREGNRQGSRGSSAPARKARPGENAGPSRAKAAVSQAGPSVTGEAPLRIRFVRESIGLKQSQMSRLLGISLRKLSELESLDVEPRLDTTKRRLTEIERLRQALAEIVPQDVIAAWMDKPNPAFEGSTPLQVVERGEIDRLWQMIYAVRTGHPL